VPEFSGAFIKKVVDNAPELIARVDELTQSDVLVGVPSDKAGRKKGPITNAALAYIHEHGSPARNIPARPFLFPGVRKIRAQAVTLMREAAITVLKGEGGKGAVNSVLQRVGMLARNSVVSYITDPDVPFAPLKPATIRARLRRTAAGRRKLQEIMEGGKELGMSSADILTKYARANWDTGGEGMNAKPLIDTGQLRASITYVIRKGKG
jgi:phage gpG-like protein